MSEKTWNTLQRVAIPIALGVALLSVSIWGAARSAKAESYEIAATNMYTRAFVELADTMGELSVTLGKLQAVNAPNQTVLLLDDVWRLSGAAASLLSQIPQSHLNTEPLNRFVVQLGDYAHTLTAKAVRGTPMSAEDTEQLDTLYSISKGLASDLRTRLEDGDFPTEGIDGAAFFAPEEDGAAGGEAATPGLTPDASASPGGGGPGGSATAAPTAAQTSTPPQSAAPDSAAAGGDASKSQESITEFPTLIYDGPFSESTEKAEPKGLTGTPVTQEQAQAIAEKAVGHPLTFCGLSDGRIKSFDFCGQDENGKNVDVSITAKGGHLLWHMGQAETELNGVPPQSETARYRDIALKYLSTLGYASMRATYAQYYGGCALINCAATQDNVILYSDLIKVWVDRQTLEVVGMDARNYLFSHTGRSLPAPAITLQEAESLLSSRLTVQDRALALIPLNAQTEVLCYEFKCALGTDAYILYINAQTGEEEQIFRIIDSEDGQLVL
ncbi:MAG: germination protein YpeB [Clostridia bacterium]|nr:germination protein YpeB [Clostridia bacterium]